MWVSGPLFNWAANEIEAKATFSPLLRDQSEEVNQCEVLVYNSSNLQQYTE
jgi:hypothetical protein